MRLTERTLKTVDIAARRVSTGTLGGQTEAFAGSTVAVRASVLPDVGNLELLGDGLHAARRLRLIVPDDTRVLEGDRLIVDGARYRVTCVREWTAHLELTARAERA